MDKEIRTYKEIVDLIIRHKDSIETYPSLGKITITFDDVDYYVKEETYNDLIIFCEKYFENEVREINNLKVYKEKIHSFDEVVKLFMDQTKFVIDSYEEEVWNGNDGRSGSCPYDIESYDEVIFDEELFVKVETYKELVNFCKLYFNNQDIERINLKVK